MTGIDSIGISVSGSNKGGDSAISYIEIFQNPKDFAISVVNSYSEDQLMHTFLDNLYQGGRYSYQIAIHQAELRREEKLLIINHYLYCLTN